MDERTKTLKLIAMSDFKILYTKPKGFLRELIQKFFLNILIKIFPNKFLDYKKSVKNIMNKAAFKVTFILNIIYLRFRYLNYITLPSRHLYALNLLINFLSIVKKKEINLFLLGGTLLGAVRQESFAGRPTDVDLGITETQFPALLESIPLLKKSGARVVRRFPIKDPVRLQILFSNSLVDVGVYKKKYIKNNEVWIGETDSGNGITFPITDLENLVPIKLYGKFFLSPSNPSAYLEKKYGKNWRKPDKKQFFWNKNKFL